MKKLLIFSILFFISLLSQAQKIGGGCEDCDLMYAGMPKELNWQTTIADAKEEGERMEISGTIYQKDGKTPAVGVIFLTFKLEKKQEILISQTKETR